METFLTLMILAGTTCASSIVPETRCNTAQIFFSCNPVPGATLYLKLMTNATGYMLVFWKDLPKKFPVFKVINETVTIRESYRNRTKFFIDTGTLKITEVKKDDAGRYSLYVYTPDGRMVQMYSFTLNVKEEKSVSIKIRIPTYAVVAVIIIIILVGFLVWKRKFCRKTGYQTLQ